MKLKYYLRGLGIGIIVTTIVLAISFSQRKVEISDEEIIARATMLGMVMEEEADAEDAAQTETQQMSDEEQSQMMQAAGTEQDDAIDTEEAADAKEPAERDEAADNKESADAKEPAEKDEAADSKESADAKESAEGDEAADSKEPADVKESAEKDDAADAEEKTQAGTASNTEETPGTTPVKEGSYRLVIKKGDVCRVVCENLAANGVIDDAEALRKYLFEIGYASSMSVGTYDIPYGLTNEEIAQTLKAGPIEKKS